MWDQFMRCGIRRSTYIFRTGGKWYARWNGIDAVSLQKKF